MTNIFHFQVLSLFNISPGLELDAYYQQYLDWSKQDQDNLDYFRVFVDIFTDSGFVCPADVVARAYASVNMPVYRYLVSIHRIGRPH